MFYGGSFSFFSETYSGCKFVSSSSSYFKVLFSCLQTLLFPPCTCFLIAFLIPLRAECGFKNAAQVHQFIELVRGRARTSLLLENKTALINIDSILQVPGIDEIHIGLNDLRLSLGLDIIFEILCLDILEEPSKKIRQAGIRFGFGGVTSPTITNLPIAPTHIIAEQVRLGSTLALLGRSFRHPFEQHPNVHGLKEAVDTIHQCIEYWQQASEDKHLQNRTELQQAILRWRSEFIGESINILG